VNSTERKFHTEGAEITEDTRERKISTGAPAVRIDVACK
jgi:hypothetical protein